MDEILNEAMAFVAIFNLTREFKWSSSERAHKSKRGRKV